MAKKTKINEIMNNLAAGKRFYKIRWKRFLIRIGLLVTLPITLTFFLLIGLYMLLTSIIYRGSGDPFMALGYLFDAWDRGWNYDHDRGFWY